MKIIAMIEVGLGTASPTVAQIRDALTKLYHDGFEPSEIITSEETASWIEASYSSLGLPRRRSETTGEIFGVPVLVRNGETVIRAGRTEHPCPDTFPATVAINKRINWAKVRA